MSFKSVCLFSLLCFWMLPVQAGDIFQQAMVRLDRTVANATEVETLAQFRHKPMIVSFFMPNCKWCQKQHKNLKRIEQTCPNAQVIMLGVQGNYQRLKRELHKERNHFPAYVANKEIVQAIGSQSPVPMTLIFDEVGGLVLKTVGYTSKEKLIALSLEKQLDICHSI